MQPVNSQRGDAFNGERGFTMIEIVVVLAVIALLAAVLTPMVIKYVRDARVAKAQADTKAVATAIGKLEMDVNHYPFFSNGAASTIREVDANVTTLYGPGDEPKEATATSWTTGSNSSCASSVPTTAATARDELKDHLVSNGATWPTSSTLARPGAWKGPYLEDISADPWGNKYLVNIINTASGCTKASFALSAGPNGTIETAYDIERTASLVPAGDDIIAVLK